MISLGGPALLLKPGRRSDILLLTDEVWRIRRTHLGAHTADVACFRINDCTCLRDRDRIVEAAAQADAAFRTLGSIDHHADVGRFPRHFSGLEHVRKRESPYVGQTLVALAFHPGADVVLPLLADLVPLQHDPGAGLNERGANHDDSG